MTKGNGCYSANRVSLDVVFEALSDVMRRRILVALTTETPRLQDEFETVEFRPEDREQETISAELRHAHLPKLDETGFIDWDREAGRVTRGDDFEAIEPLLELMDNHQDELPDGWP